MTNKFIEVVKKWRAVGSVSDKELRMNAKAAGATFYAASDAYYAAYYAAYDAAKANEEDASDARDAAAAYAAAYAAYAAARAAYAARDAYAACAAYSDAGVMVKQYEELTNERQ
jgi:hypothetical protein